MSSFDEIRKNLQKKYNTSATGTSGSAAESGSSNGSGSSFEEIRSHLRDKYSAENVSKMRTSLNNWVDKYNATTKGISDFNARRNGGFTTDASGGYAEDVASLIREFDGIKDYADKLGLPNAKRYVTELKNLQSSIKQNNDFLAQFSNEDEYNAWKEEYENVEAMKAFDIEAGAKEIAQLEEVLKEYNSLSRLNLSGKWQERFDELAAEYGSAKNIKALISQKQQYLTQAQRLQDSARMKGVADSKSEFYDPFFTYWANMRGNLPTQQEMENYDTMMDRSTWQMMDDGKLYDALGNEIDYRKRDASGKVVHPYADSVDTTDKLGIYLAAKADSVAYSTTENAWGTLDRILAEGESRHWDKLTEDQINTYYYYLNKEGAESAEKYLDLVQYDVNEVVGAEKYSNVEDSNALKLLFGVRAGLDQWGSGLAGLGRELRGEEGYVNPTATQFAAAKVGEDLDEAGGLWRTAYDAVTTVSNMAPSFLTGVVANALLPGSGFVGTALMGASASGSAYDEMINEGYSVKQARTYGALIGASEVALESLLGGISEIGGGALGKPILKALAGADSALYKFVVNMGNTAAGRILGSMIDEGKEEGLQEILGTWLKNIITHSDEDVDWNEVAYSALLGAITGGVFEGTGVAVEAAFNRGNKNIGNAAVGTDNSVPALTVQDIPAVKLSESQTEPTGTAGATVRENRTVSKTETVPAKGQQATGKLTGKESLQVETQLSGEKSTEGTGSLEEASKKYGAQAGAMVATYNSGQDVAKFDQAYQLAYDMGKNGVKLEYVKSREAISYLTDVQKDLAYEAGAYAAKQERAENMKFEQFTAVDGKTATARISGEEMNLTEVTLPNESENLVLHSVASYANITAEAANSVMQAYRDGDVPANAFVIGAGQAYRWGYYGYSKASLAKQEDAAKLTSSQMDSIYNAGRNAAAERYAEKQKTVVKESLRTAKQGAVYYGYLGQTMNTREKSGFTEQQRVGVDFARRLAKSRGTTFYFYESYVDESGERVYMNSYGDVVKAPNGYYDPVDGSIHIDLNAGSGVKGTVMFTIAHELTHYIKDWSPKHFKKLADIVVAKYNEWDLPMDEVVKQQQIDAEADGRELSYDEAFEEVIASSMESILTDGKVMEFMAELEQKDKTLAEKVKAFFRNIMDLIRDTINAYKNISPESFEANVVSQMEEVLEQLQQIFAKGVYEAGENLNKAEKSTTGEGGVKYQTGAKRTAQADVTAKYQSAVDQVLNLQNTKQDHLIIGYTPDVYTSLGMPSLPFVIGTGHVYSAAKSEAEAKLEGNYRKGVHYHGLGANVIKNIYDALKKPIMIIASKDVSKNTTPMRSTHSVVAIVDVGNAQKSLLLPVEITAERSVNGERMDVNALSSVYDKMVANLVNEAIAMENTGEVGIYYAKKEALTLPGAGVQFPVQLQQSIASSGIIHSFSEKVNMNISDATQSQQFKRWFGDWQNRPEKASKVVNADGTPKVMYHGSPAQFTVFDKKKAKSSGHYGRGFYFTDSDTQASVYGNRYAVYLNVKQPLEYGRTTVSRSQVQKYLEAIAENEDYSIENYGTYEVDEIMDAVMGSAKQADAFRAIQDISATAIGDMVEATELFNSLNGTKFDGIITSTETVVFRPEQIKSATDNIGTFDGRNPDIRYSARYQRQRGAQEILESENAKLQEEVGYLKQLLKLQRTVTGGTKFTKSSVEAMAQILKKNADAKGDTKELADMLNEFYAFIATDKELTWETVKEKAAPIVKWLQDHVQIKQARSEYAQDILSTLHNSRVYLDESQQAEAAYQYGSFDNFRKRAMGSIIIAKDNSLSLDSFWHEMSTLYPDVFDEETTSTDMPGALMDIVDRLRNTDTSALEYFHNKDLIAQDLLRQVYDSYWRVSTLRTVADVKQKEINALKSKHMQRMEDMKENFKSRVEKMKSDHREALKQRDADWRQKMQTQQKEITKRYQDARKKRSEDHHKTEMRMKIRKTIRDLRKILNHGDKKRNVKEDMKDMVSKAIDSAEVLFTQTYTDEDIVRYGFEVQLNADEDRYFREAQQIIQDMDKVGPGNEAALDKLKNRLDYRMGKLRDALYRERNRMNEATVSQVLGDLADAYASLESSEYNYVSGAYHAEVYEYLKRLQTEMGGAKVRDMSMTQLEELHKAYKMVLETVRNANKMFNEDLKQTRDELGNAVMREVQKAGGEHGGWSKLGIQANKFSWNNLKPIYATERIGSETFSKIMGGLFDGQYKWATNMEKARDFRRAVAEKHKANSWDLEKTHTFTSTNGHELTLNVGHILSLYAYSKRDAAHDHLTGGGIVFANGTEVVENHLGVKVHTILESATTYTIGEELLAEIISKLDENQKKYVDEMQTYLSETMGGLGNEVSMRLYGVKLYGEEKNYFPLRVSAEHKEQAAETELKEERGLPSLKNSGFTHSLKPHAKDPIVLDDFNTVWAEHVNDMTMYNGMVLPLEDFRKVFYFRTPHDGGTQSVKGAIINAYGRAARAYFNQLYQELNSGAISDPREAGMIKWVGKFKKAAVMASMSVVVQQPSAIGRAFSEIHPKFFVGEKIGEKREKQLWEEVKRYAPVAIIKEMGGFDTHTGAGAKDYLLAKEYSKGEIAKALRQDKDYRKETYDMVLGYLPAKADEITWVAIWQAAKREVKAQNQNISGEELLRKAGERFSQVIERTQVYDSVLARSANMRAKTGLMAMTTAFMAEPTTTINMLETAIRGKKNVKRVLASVATSIVLNNMLASVIYAMRDDDEDETFLEKYAEAFTSGMADDLNPITYYPFLKDAWSVMQGYSVERSDMSIVSDLATSLTNAQKIFDKDTSGMDADALAAYNKERWDAILTVADSAFSMLGFPLKNIRRDIESVVNTRDTMTSGLENEETSLWNHIVDAYIGTIPFVRNKWKRSKSDLLYQAIVDGNGAYEARLRSEYETEDQITAAIRKGLKDNDARIYEAALMQMGGQPQERVRLQKEVIAEGFLQDDVVTATNSIINKLTPSEPAAEPKKKGFYSTEDFTLFVVNGQSDYAKEAKADIIATHEKNGKTADEATASFKSSAKSDLKEAFLAGNLTAATAEHALKAYCGEEAADAKTIVNKWRSINDTGIAYDDIKAEFMSGNITAAKAIDMRVSYGGYSREDAEAVVAEWQYEKDYPELSKQYTYNEYKQWESYGKPNGVAFELYADVYDFRDNGPAESTTSQDKVWDYIDGLNISKAQKDAIHLCFWKESTLHKAPWNN